MNKDVSIVLCTYNEANYIEQTIKLIIKTVKNVEIIVVDDDSTDGTIEKLNSLKSTYNFKLFIRKNEKGLASAIKKGFNESNGEFIGFIDVNSSDQILYFDKLISKLENGYDISVLSRYIVGGGDKRVFLRTITSKVINLICKSVLRIKFNDFTSGIFLMKKKVLNDVKVDPNGHGEYFIEFIYSAYKKKFKIIEIPYIQMKDDNLSKSKSNPNIFHFFYLGFIYFFRILLAIFRN